MSTAIVLPRDLSAADSNGEAGYIEMPSGLVLPRSVAAEQLGKMRRPTCVDLFAGCGGFSLGMMEGGFRVLAGLDNEPIAAVTYMANLGSYPCQFHFISDADEVALDKCLRKTKRAAKGSTRDIEEFPTAGSGWIASRPDVPGVEHFFLGDVRRIRGADILEAVGLGVGELDCVVGGPPCQGFSYANKNRRVLDPRNSLVFEFVRLVCEMRPKSMVMENVPGIVDMLTPEGTPVVDALCRILEDGGFAGYDALRRSMAAQTGAVGLLRGRSPKKARTPRRGANSSTSRDLFDTEAHSAVADG